MEIVVLTFIIALLTCCSAYCSGSEAALFSLSSTKLRAYHSDPNPRRRMIASLLHHPQDLLVTVFMLNTLVNILLQNVTAHLFGDLAGWHLKVGVPLILTLVFGEIIPKYLGLQNNLAFSYWVAPSINFLQKVLAPIRKITVAITDPISRILFFFLKKEPSISQEEMQHVLKTSQEHGVLDPDEADFVCGYLHLQEASVNEVARPREEIIYYDIMEPISKLTHLFVDEECSRIPVCDKNLDNILGIITAKQFFLHRHNVVVGKDLDPILTKPFYVPENTSARMLLRRLDEKRQVLAIVVDEYGSVSGLITREDLIEVVIGQISDRRDQKNLYTRSGKNEIIASGKLELEEFNEIFDVALSSQGNMATIGGWLTEKLGEIPKSGKKYEFENFLFQVLAASPSFIKRLYIRKLTSTERR